MNAFAQGMQIGVGMSQGWTNQRLQRDELDQRKRLIDMKEMEAEANKKRMAMMEDEFNSNMALKREEAARFVESEAAFERWGKATAAIDWSSPTARTEYEQATQLHLPTILKHDGARRKWEAMHGVTMKNAAYTDSKTAEIQLSDLAHKALLSGAGPDAIGIQADVKAGKISIHEGLTKLSDVMRARDKELFERDLQLRRISNPERPNYRAATLPSEESTLKRLAQQREELTVELRKVSRDGTEPQPKPRWFGAPNDSDGERYRRVKAQIADLDAQEAEINRGIEARVGGWGRGVADLPAPDSGDSAGPLRRNPRGQRMGGPGDQTAGGGAASRYRIEILPSPGDSGTTVSQMVSALDEPSPAPRPSAPEPEAPRETLLDYVRAKAGRYDSLRPRALNAFGKPAVVGRRDWDEESAIAWAKDRVSRLRESNVPRDREELARILELLRPYEGSRP